MNAKEQMSKATVDPISGFTEFKLCRQMSFQVNDSVWSFLLSGGLGVGTGVSSPPEHLQPNPHPEWLSKKSWDECVRASSLLLHCQVSTHMGKKDGS